METVYILVDGGGRVSVYKSFREALEAAARHTPPVKIYRASLVAILEEEETRSLGGAAGREAGAAAEKRERGSNLAVVVFDQMFRGFGEVVKRELGEAVEVHEVVGKGLEQTMEAGGVYYEPASSDYDVIKLVERLAKEKRLPVILFTGDKKLARQAAMIEGVDVEYLPPSEIPGKEIAIRRMLEKIRRVVEEAWGL